MLGIEIVSCVQFLRSGRRRRVNDALGSRSSGRSADKKMLTWLIDLPLIANDGQNLFHDISLLARLRDSRTIISFNFSPLLFSSPLSRIYHRLTHINGHFSEAIKTGVSLGWSPESANRRRSMLATAARENDQHGTQRRSKQTVVDEMLIVQWPSEQDDLPNGGSLRSN